ncbi:SEC-C metal-binding domain-containing protein [Fusibacter bizertensis]|uniref:SEC-C metal-binding domain-containing protein n=1 Tax=Fusibacter bizertensis TaxID=1488331 RepID=A0ABT6NEC7_9FIRM|nr:SEC-C metal-binding domain-containing protein [Fusibacter bizertensis]MDH8678715.1 SEC-C metal-binding domain-containing protein [Fusibacter bizertensis]
MKLSDAQIEQELTDLLSRHCLEDIARYVISANPSQKLSVCLGKVGKPALVERAMLLEIANYDTLKKAELVKVLLTHYQEPKVIMEIVTWSTPDEKRILKELMTGISLYLSKTEIVSVYIDLKFLLSTGLVHVFEVEGEYVLKLQEEIRDKLLALNWKTVERASAQAVEVVKYGAASTSLYGALPIAKLYELYADYHQGEALIPKTKFKKLLSGAMIRPQTYWTDGQYLYADYFDVEELDALVTLYALNDGEDLEGSILLEILRSNKPYYRPDLDTFLKYAEPDYEPENLKLDDLMKFLKKFGTLKPDIWDDLRDEILYTVEFGNLQETLAALESFGIRFKSRGDIDKFIKFYTEVVNHTRIWVNRGYTPVELRKLTTPSATPSATSTTIPMRNGYDGGSVNASDLPTKKVGRNEPCPCGSGKKYKRCCGAN